MGKRHTLIIIFHCIFLLFIFQSASAQQDVWVKSVIADSGVPFTKGSSIGICCYVGQTQITDPSGVIIVVKVDGNQIGIFNGFKNDKKCSAVKEEYGYYSRFMIPATGSYKAECLVDPDNKIQEANEENNAVELPIYTLDSKTLIKLSQQMKVKSADVIKMYRMPDLLMGRFEVKPEKSAVTEGEYNFLLKCEWKRTGPKPIFPFKIKIWKGSEVDQALVKDADLTAEDQVVEANISVLIKGPILFHCSVDPEGKIQESNEYNNMKTIIFRMAEAPKNSEN